LPGARTKPKKRRTSPLSEKKFLKLGRKHFAEDFPNPKRQGCPPKNQLKLLAEKPRKAKESVLNHISFCSPCYRTYSHFLQIQKARRSSRVKRRTGLEALREKLTMIDAFVHIVHSTRPAQTGEPSFAVMFAPVGPTGSGGAMKPHYVSGWAQLVGFLRDVGFTEEAACGIESDLRKQPSVSVRMNLARPVASTNFYRLRFRPEWVDAGKQSWPKVTLIGEPLSADTKRWSATFHDVDKCLNVVSQCVGSPPPQLAAIRRSVLQGQLTELGGSGGDVQFVVREAQLMQMGLAPAEQ